MAGIGWYVDLTNVYFPEEKFPDRVISRRGDHNWPPRSYDLTLCDFFLWGHVKDKVYAIISPSSIQALKDYNFKKRILSCRRGRGGHLADVFHY